MKLKCIARFFISLFLITMLFGGTANATTLYTFDDYKVTVYTDGTNPFGMNTGDVVDVDIEIFDSATAYTSGIYTTYSTGLSLSFVLADGTDFDQEDDTWWSAWPIVTVNTETSKIDSIEFRTISDGYVINIGASDEDIPSPIVMTISAVPEPGTFALLSLALLSLTGLQRKRS